MFHSHSFAILSQSLSVVLTWQFLACPPKLINKCQFIYRSRAIAVEYVNVMITYVSCNTPELTEARAAAAAAALLGEAVSVDGE